LPVRKTALWFEPPSHRCNGNFPSTTDPSQFFQSSVGMLISGIAAKPLFYSCSALNALWKAGGKTGFAETLRVPWSSGINRSSRGTGVFFSEVDRPVTP